MKQFYWHDENLVKMEIDYPAKADERGRVILALDLYDSQDAPRRTRRKLEFNDVLNINKAADLEDFGDNACAGTIEKADFTKNDRNEHVFILTFVFGGFLEIIFRDIVMLDNERISL